MSLSPIRSAFRRMPARQPNYVPIRVPDACPDCNSFGWVLGQYATPCHCYQDSASQTSIPTSPIPVPHRMARNMTFEAFDRTGTPSSEPHHHRSLSKALDTMIQWANEPAGWILMTGPTGTGKTHLAVAAVLTFAQAGHPIAFITVSELLNTLRKATFIDTDLNTLEAMKSVPLLVLDDMGTERTTAFAEELLHLIINHRYEHAIPTIITSNLTPKRISEIRPATASRMLDYRNTIHIVIQAPDYRVNPE